MRRRLLLALTLTACCPSIAIAACSSPFGNAGEQIYNGDYAVMQFCNGTNWVSMAGGGNAGTTFALGSVSAPGFSPIGDSNTGLFSPSADAVAFATNGSERFRIDSAGNLGIGTTSPAYPLAVESGGGTSLYARTGASGGWAGYFHNNDSGGNRYAQLAGGTYAGIFMNGNVGIGTTGPGYTLDVNGTARANQLRWSDLVQTASAMCYSTGSGQYVVGICSSVRSLKDNIRNLSLGGIETVMKLRPVEYDWKKEQGGFHDLGFIAEEVEQIAPILAVYDNGVLRSVNYPHMTALLTKAIQELKVENTMLQQRLDRLEGLSRPPSSSKP